MTLNDNIYFFLLQVKNHTNAISRAVNGALQDPMSSRATYENTREPSLSSARFATVVSPALTISLFT